MKTTLHIVSFNVPLPANYGGVIDVFYKIKALHQQGVKIILHCFIYNREQNLDLEKYCEQVYYYPRKRGIKYLLSTEPYIVITRKNKELIKKLAADDYPILFEGLHCCGFNNHPLLKFKNKFIRIHNVEHQYYQHLAKEEKSVFKKLFFLLEAYKLKIFEKEIPYAQHLLVLSKYDEHYYRKIHPQVHLIPPFHQYNALNIVDQVSDYLLFNADFSISINYKFAKELSLWAEKANRKLILAGKVGAEISDELTIIQNPTEAELDLLVANALVNIVSSDQPSGFKLKLVHALYRSKNMVVIGQFLEEFHLFACPELKHISSLDNLPLCLKEIEDNQTPINQVLMQRLKAIQYFDQLKQAKQISSLL